MPLIMIVSLLLNMCLQGAICFCVYRTLRGEEAAFGECIAKGLGRLGTILLTALLIGFGIVGYLMLSGVVIALLFNVSRFSAVLAIMALVFLFLFVFLRVGLALPVCVIERAGALASIRRSSELTRGNLLRIFAVILLLSMICGVIVLLFTVPLVLASGSNFLLITLFSWIIRALPFVLGFVSLPVMYCQLRAIKENYSIVDEADVFD
jgi:hypothetical protein